MVYSIICSDTIKRSRLKSCHLPSLLLSFDSSVVCSIAESDMKKICTNIFYMICKIIFSQFRTLPTLTFWSSIAEPLADYRPELMPYFEDFSLKIFSIPMSFETMKALIMTMNSYTFPSGIFPCISL